MEFAPQNYTVVEGEPFVTVNVSASGFPEAPFDMVDNISVLLTTEDGSAEGKIELLCRAMPHYHSSN